MHAILVISIKGLLIRKQTATPPTTVYRYADLNFMVCQSTAKTTKIGSSKISSYRVYHIPIIVLIKYDLK